MKAWSFHIVYPPHVCGPVRVPGFHVWGTFSPVWGQGHMWQDGCLKMVLRFTLSGGQGEPHHRVRAVDLNHWQREREGRMVFLGLCTSLGSTSSRLCEIPHAPSYFMGEGSAVLCVLAWSLMGHGCWVAALWICEVQARQWEKDHLQQVQLTLAETWQVTVLKNSLPAKEKSVSMFNNIYLFEVGL